MAKIERLNDNPKFAAEVAKLNRFAEKLTTLDAERTKINVASQASQASTGDPVEAALAMLDGDKISREDYSARLGEIAAEERLLREAIASQTQTIEVVAAKISAEVCAKFYGDHQAAARRILVAMEELDAALGQAADLTNQIERAGYRTSALRDLSWPSVGRISDNSGSLAYYKYREVSRIID